MGPRARPVSSGTRASPKRDLPLVSDRAGDPTMLELGPLRLCLIERGGASLCAPATPTPGSATPSKASTTGRSIRPGVSRPASSGRQTAGSPCRTLSAPRKNRPPRGDVVFEVGAKTYRLQALAGGASGELWLVFGDATNRVETYGGGRFLYTSAPDTEGRLTVDFNRAYNPPCVFSPYATCPLPWPENVLPIRIEAGERTVHAHP